MTLSFTATVKASSKYATIYVHKGSWILSSPYRVSEPDGPRTETNSRDYTQAVMWRTLARARVALHLTGITDNETYLAIGELQGGSVMDMVRVAITQRHVALRKDRKDPFFPPNNQ